MRFELWICCELPIGLGRSASRSLVTMLFKDIFAAAAFASTAFAAPSEKRQSNKLEWFGINESGAEFGEKNFPGVKNKDYVWPTLSTIDVSKHERPKHRTSRDRS